jgi:hypothetical protein
MSEERIDPLDEREDNEAEVKRKRLLEEMAQDTEVESLTQLLQLEGVRDFLWRVISRCNTLGEPWDPNFGKASYNLGRQSIGRMLIADINLANPQAWLEMQLKAARVAQATQREEALKKLRRARSP